MKRLRTLVVTGFASLTPPVRYALAAKTWQLAALPITVLLISTNFSAETQGFYYTFFSVVALQALLELGLHTAVLNVASHESANSRLESKGELVGDFRAKQRVLGLGRFVLMWYSVAGLLFAVVAGTGGAAFFSMSGVDRGIWLWPWLALVAVASFQFVITPFNYLMEGLGQIAKVARMRWLTMPLHSAATWSLIASGASLWTAAGSSAIALIVNVIFLLAVFPRFFYQVAAEKLVQSIDWRREIWPMQWRLGVQGAVNYLFYSLFNPVLFHYHGPAEAGRFGMTLQILGGIQAAGLSWLQSTIPNLGRLVAQKKVAEMNRIWLTATKFTLFASFLGYGAFLLLTPVLAAIAPSIAARFVDPITMTILALAYLMLQPLQCMAAYMRSFKREALTWISFASGISCGLLVWVLGRTFGSLGAASALLAVIALVTLPGATLIWLNAKKKWHLELGAS